MSTTEASALYFGTVGHRRTGPVEHAFRYRLYFAYLDLDELDAVMARTPLASLGRLAPLRFCRTDHFGDPAASPREAVLERVEAVTGRRPAGPVRVLTHLRTFGFYMNPVAFWYCFDPEGASVEAVVAEVHNTPWNERHTYVLEPGGESPHGAALVARVKKAFHVSPFIGMDVDYRFVVGVPGESLAVHIENRSAGDRFFEATLRLRRRRFDTRTAASALARFPFVTLRVLRAIYWQAALLKLKGAPFHPHPESHR